MRRLYNGFIILCHKDTIREIQAIVELNGGEIIKYAHSEEQLYVISKKRYLNIMKKIEEKK